MASAGGNFKLTLRKLSLPKAPAWKLSRQAQHVCAVRVRYYSTGASW